MSTLPLIRHALALLLVAGLPAAANAKKSAPQGGRSAEDIARAYPPFPARDVKPAGLGARQIELVIDYPGPAKVRNISRGSAVVSVAIDAGGKATDFLVIGYTDEIFATTLLEHARILEYRAANVRGVDVPGRFALGYDFASRSNSGNTLDEMEKIAERISSKPLAYSAKTENDLDAPLEFTGIVLPILPEGFKPKDDKPVKAYVTFYIDEAGHVRIPQVESAPSPLLIQGAVEAISKWTFKPATAKGEPALVFTGRPIWFVSPEKAAAAAAPDATR